MAYHGSYFLNATKEYSPSHTLQAFLASGTPPVCIFFGSMGNRNIIEIDRLVRDTLIQTGNRGIILSSRTDVQNSSQDIYFIWTLLLMIGYFPNAG
jgi:sterol 3beta-glucosyltransferase